MNQEEDKANEEGRVDRGPERFWPEDKEAQRTAAYKWNGRIPGSKTTTGWPDTVRSTVKYLVVGVLGAMVIHYQVWKGLVGL